MFGIPRAVEVLALENLTSKAEEFEKENENKKKTKKKIQDISKDKENLVKKARTE